MHLRMTGMHIPSFSLLQQRHRRYDAIRHDYAQENYQNQSGSHKTRNRSSLPAIQRRRPITLHKPYDRKHNSQRKPEAEKIQ